MHKVFSGISSAAIRWLSAPGSPPLVNLAEQSSLHATIPSLECGGEGTIEILRFNLGMSLTWSARHLPNSESRVIPFANVTANSNEPILVLQSVHAGRMIMYDRSSREELPVENGSALFEHVSDINFTLLLDGSPNVEITTFIVTESALSNILGENVAQTFLSAAKLASIPSTRVLPIPRHISGILQSSLPDGLNEDMRKLFSQARALEYLCLLAAHVTGDPEVSGASQRDRQIQQLYEELLAIDGKLPPLFELAERYGMSVKTMNDNFKRMFGQTIGAFMTTQRLSDAHVALEETGIPMKVLAAKCGYSHVNNFINAFKSKYGYSPGSLRRQDEPQQALRVAAGSSF